MVPLSFLRSLPVWLLLLLSSVSSVSSSSSLGFLPEGHLSAQQREAFAADVARVQAAAVCAKPYSRHGPAHRSADQPAGSLLVLPLAERRVPVAEGFRRHLDHARHLGFPYDSRLRAAALPDDTQCAVARSLDLGAALFDARTDAASFVTAVCDRQRPASRRVAELMPPSVARISRDVNTVCIAVFIDALRWLDVTLVERFVYGFPVVGRIPDSGVYRLLNPPPSVAAFSARHDAFISTAHVWNRRFHNRLKYRRWAAPEQRALDDAVAAKTAKELSKALVVGPYSSVAALATATRAAYPGSRAINGSLPVPRPMNRFAVPQKGDVRAIDDGKSNDANGAAYLVETVTTPSFFYPALFARAVAGASAARGSLMPPLLVSLLDLSAAYRTIPSSQPWFTTFGFYNPLSGGVEYYWLPGHNFGLGAAVVNFNRYPELVVVVARAVCFVPADHYYDDFLVPDLASGRDSAARSIESIVLAFGPGVPRPKSAPYRAPEIDPGKTKEPADFNVVLGIGADLSAAHGDSARVVFRADPDRVQTVLGLFRAAFRRGLLYPHEAASLRGKLFFLLVAAYARVGRAATLPLVQRQYRDSTYEFTAGSELYQSLLFFEALLPALPPLYVPVTPRSLPPLLVYTDASFWKAGKSRPSSGACLAPHSSFRGALGAVVFDPVDSRVYVAAADPPWALLLSSWRTHFKTYIAELEALAAISVYSTYPALFAGRRVNHMIDNTVALSALVHGYSGKPELAKSVNVFYLQTVRLRANVYFDYVPSKANIADLPSRAAWPELRAELAGLTVAGGFPDSLVVPDVAAWHAPLHSWLAPSPGAPDAFVA